MVPCVSIYLSITPKLVQGFPSFGIYAIWTLSLTNCFIIKCCILSAYRFLDMTIVNHACIMSLHQKPVGQGDNTEEQLGDRDRAMSSYDRKCMWHISAAIIQKTLL